MFQTETLARGFPRVDLASRLASSRSASDPKPTPPSPPPPLLSSSDSVSAAPPQPAHYTRSVSVRPSRHLCCSRTTTLLANSKRPTRGERNNFSRDHPVACVASPSTAAASPALIPGLTIPPTQLPLPSTSYLSSPVPSRPPSVSPCPPPSPLTLPSDTEQAAPLSARRSRRGRRTASPSGGHQQHQLMCQPPSERTLRAVLGAILPAQVTIQKKSWAFSSASGNRVQRIYGLGLSDGRELRLVMDPDPSLRLLRSEQWLVESEAAVVRWVRDVLTREKLAVNKVLNLESHQHRHRRSGSSGSGGSSNTIDRSTTRHLTSPGVVVSHSGGPFSGPSSSPPSSTHHAHAFSRPHTRWPDPGLLDFVPSLLSPPTSTDTPSSASSSHPPSPPSVFAIFGLPRQSSNRQTTASQLLLQSSAPDPSEQKAVDFQVGRFVRQISRLISPTGRFGPAVAVLPCSPSSSAADGAGGRASNNGNGNSNKAPVVPSLGAGTWSMAFHSMLEGVLRDGEDMAVTVPYVHIRRHFRRLGFLLDAVTTPRLVLVDAADYSNVMVVVTERDFSEGVEKNRGGGETKAAPTETKGNEPTTTRTTEAAEHQGDSASEKVMFTGLADWSNCVFGDPLFTRAFCDGSPSAEFLDGFNGSSPTDADDDDNDLIDDRDVSPIRLLLYQCYHLTVCIVREFYRPHGGGGSTSRELEARRKLREVLARLEEVDDDPKRRHRRPSGDMSPAKKSRQGS